MLHCFEIFWANHFLPFLVASRFTAYAIATACLGFLPAAISLRRLPVNAALEDDFFKGMIIPIGNMRVSLSDFDKKVGQFVTLTQNAHRQDAPRR